MINGSSLFYSSDAVRVLAGGEKDVHPQLAFAILMSGITKSEKRQHWAFQLKNMLILSQYNPLTQLRR